MKCVRRFSILVVWCSFSYVCSMDRYPGQDSDPYYQQRSEESASDDSSENVDTRTPFERVQQDGLPFTLPEKKSFLKVCIEKAKHFWQNLRGN